MENKKYYLKPTSLISSMYKIYSIIFFIIAIFVWYRIKDIKFEFYFPAWIILLIPIIFFIFYWFIFDRFHYFKLTDNRLILYKIIPSVIMDYQKIKNISISQNILMNIEYEYPFGVTFPNKVLWKYKVCEMDEFIEEFSKKYKSATGKSLIIN